MLTIERTALFDKWLRSLKDTIGKHRIQARLDMLALGHWGDCKPVGAGVTELRLHTGPGYRLYCCCTAYGQAIKGIGSTLYGKGK